MGRDLQGVIAALWWGVGGGGSVRPTMREDVREMYPFTLQLLLQAAQVRNTPSITELKGKGMLWYSSYC
jgi:hypothetical protein